MLYIRKRLMCRRRRRAPMRSKTQIMTHSQRRMTQTNNLWCWPQCIEHGDFCMIYMIKREILWSFSFCTEHYDMIYMHVESPFYIFYGFLWVSFYDDSYMMYMTYLCMDIWWCMMQCISYMRWLMCHSRMSLSIWSASLLILMGTCINEMDSKHLTKFLVCMKFVKR